MKNKMKEAFEIARIIQKSLKGELSDLEAKRLSDWRTASDENERAFQQNDFRRFLHGWNREVRGV